MNPPLNGDRQHSRNLSQRQNWLKTILRSTTLLLRPSSKQLPLFAPELIRYMMGMPTQSFFNSMPVTARGKASLAS
jgi:hypothetical protein